jgi:hypothetical protein
MYLEDIVFQGGSLSHNGEALTIALALILSDIGM